MDDFHYRGKRRQLIEELRQEGIYDEKVLAVMENLPRHVFMESGFHSYAYRNEAFPIDCDQTISQPSTVAWQTTALELLPRQHILEIGTGSGYQAAVLSLLGGRVFTVERHKALYRKSKLTFKKLKLDRRIRSYLRDGSKGLAEMAPYDRILVTAGAIGVPDALLQQLKVGGILVIPVGPADDMQKLLRIKRESLTHWTEEELGDCQFVPLIEDK